ncbi:MAG: translation factor GTPase family protein [Clostridia bacterium]
MKKIVMGILAHVDSGKTTLSEALLFEAGNIKKMGRVDNGDATLDTHEIERKRGITIFSKQAMLQLNDTQISLLDTPGHTDFSSEMERTLSVLDYAILVINGVDGVQSHTETLWNLLREHNVPTFIFANKMDLITADKEMVIEQLKTKLSVNICDVDSEDFIEKVAETDEKLLETYFDGGEIEDKFIATAIQRRQVFPCFFGSALKPIGVTNLLDAFEKYLEMPNYNAKFSAKVFKISRDTQNTRLTHVKITGGSLNVKEVLENDEKVQQIRIYTGENFEVKNNVSAGDVCAIVGLNQTYAGQGLCQEDEGEPVLQPILSYNVLLLDGTDPVVAYSKLKMLGDEDPLLSVVWNEYTQKITMGIMGEIQIEILQTIAQERFGLDIAFDSGNIVYKETICEKVEGVGHFEPLRHYAEVRLLIEPLKTGSGIVLRTKCKEEQLARSFQALILSNLAEKGHRGTLTGSYLTDLSITVVGGRAHNKHTEGGDFRQATYRALQQGLRQTKMQLLEPFYEFTLTIPQNVLGRAMNDLDKLFATIEPPIIEGDNAIIKGKGPVILMRDYAKDIASYTKGTGKISCKFLAYLPCHNQDEIIKNYDFDPSIDPDMNPDSVFCSHGSGYNVKWNEVEEHAHTEKFLVKEKPITVNQIRTNAAKLLTSFEQDKALMKIFESTYGPIKVDKIRSFSNSGSSQNTYKKSDFSKPEILLVDGYNIIFAWEKLAKLAADSIENARHELINMMCNYKAFRGCEVILVFDAYKVRGNHGEIEHHHGINIVYTREAETADMYIEKTTYGIARNFKVRVATSDALEQLIIWGHGAFRVSAETFYEEVMQIDKAIREFCV